MTVSAAPPYDPDAIFQPDGPIDPRFIDESIRTLMRTLPIDPLEPRAWVLRRMDSAIRALAAMHPRDEIEVMLGVQALSAYQAAAACWRIGMNLRQPNGDSTRHITAAASAARTFDALLRGLERRQAKPLAVPPGRLAPRIWPDAGATGLVQALEARCRQGDAEPKPEASAESWSDQDVADTEALGEQERLARENEGLDIANTEGILPGGGMIMPENPTPQQDAYIARRLALMYRREHAENLRKGIKGYPKIRPLRTGDHVP